MFHVKLLTQALLSVHFLCPLLFDLGTVRSKREKKMHLISTDISWLLLRIYMVFNCFRLSESSIYVSRDYRCLDDLEDVSQRTRFFCVGR